MSDQPDLIGLKMGEFQQKNEDAEKFCKKSREEPRCTADTAA